MSASIRPTLNPISAICAAILVDMVDFPGYSYHSGIVFSIFQPKTGVPLINGGQYKTPFSKANKKERKGMGFDIDLISILKLQSK